MAITAVPSSQVAQAPSARVAVLPVNKHPEPSRTAQPSAIARISPEGKLRAEQDRQQVAAPASLNAVSQANAVPRRTPIEEATDVAAIAAVAVPVPNPNLPPRQLNDAQPVEQAVKAVEATVRRDQQPAPSKLERAEAPVPAGISVAVPLPARAEPNRPLVEPQRLSRTEAAPANEALHVASAPAKSTPVTHASVTDSSVTEHRVNQSRITQTAHDFVAAINQQQSRRSQVKQSAASASQVPAANTPAPGSAAPSNIRNDSAGVENSVRRVEVSSTRVDSASLTAGVVRNSEAPVQSQGNAAVSVTRDETNDTARNARSSATRGEHSPTPASVSSRAAAPAETISQIQAHSIAANQQVQTERQNSATLSFSNQANQAGGASVDQGGGLAKHLNALANLLTP